MRLRGALAVVVVLVLAAGGLGSHAAALPPVQGDWVVTGPELVANRTVVVNGSLVIASTGRLTLRNVTLLINSASDGQESLRVNASGSLDVEGSRIAALDPSRTFRFLVLGNATLRATVVEDLWGLLGFPFPGGIQVLGGSLTVSDTVVRRSQTNGIHVVNGGLHARNITVYDTPRFGVYLNHTPNATIDASLLYDYPSLVSGGIWVVDSPNFSLSNTTLRSYFQFGLWALRSNGLRVDRCVFRDREPTPSVWVEGSENVAITDTLIQNTSISTGITFTTGSSGRLDNVTIPGESSVQVARADLSISRSQLGGGIGIEDARVEVNASSIVGMVDLMRADYFATNTTHDRGSGILFSLVNGSKAILTNYSADFSWLYVEMIDREYNASNPSEIIVRNFLSVRTIRFPDVLLPDVDLRVSTGGRQTYASPRFGGPDPQIDADGRSPTLILLDRVYHKDWAMPGVKPFENITYVPTQAEVALNGTRFANNPRDVEMARSHEETFVGDATPPFVVSVGAEPDPGDLGSPVELRAVAVDDWRVASAQAEVVGPTGTRWNLSLAESQPGLFTATRAFPDLGAYIVSVTATDPVGWSSTATGSFRIADLSGPRIANLTATPSAANPGQTVRVTVNVTDNVAVASVSLDVGGPGPAENVTMTRTGGSYEALLNRTALGRYDLTVWAEDADGRWSRATGSFSVGDFLPPVTTLQIGTPRMDRGPLTYVGPSTPLTLSADDGTYGSGIAQILYRWDGNPWIAYTLPLVVSGIEGPRLLEYFAVDAAGNAEAVRSRVVVLDRTGPVTTLAIGEPRADAAPVVVGPETSFTLQAEDAGSGVGDVRYAVDGLWSSYQGPFDLPPTRGHATVSIQAFDLLGNAGGVRTLEVFVDAAAPSAAFTAVPAGPFAGERVHLSGSASTDDGGIASYGWTVIGPGGRLDLQGREVEFAPNATGRYTLVLVVTDVLGRTSTAVLTLDVRTVPGPDWTLGVALLGVAIVGTVLAAAIVFVRPRWRRGREPGSRG